MRIPIAKDLYIPALDPHRVSGWYPIHMGEEGLFEPWQIAQEAVENRRPVQLFRDCGMTDDRVQRSRDHKFALASGEEQRMISKRIPRAYQQITLAVPQNQGKESPELADKSLAPTPVAFQD